MRSNDCVTGPKYCPKCSAELDSRAKICKLYNLNKEKNIKKKHYKLKKKTKIKKKRKKIEN